MAQKKTVYLACLLRTVLSDELQLVAIEKFPKFDNYTWETFISSLLTIFPLSVSFYNATERGKIQMKRFKTAIWLGIEDNMFGAEMHGVTPWRRN